MEKLITKKDAATLIISETVSTETHLTKSQILERIEMAENNLKSLIEQKEKTVAELNQYSAFLAEADKLGLKTDSEIIEESKKEAEHE